MQPSVDLKLADLLAELYADPLNFVIFAFPWGEPGTPLADYSGPDAWQREVLREIGAAVKERGFDGVQAVKPIREAIASGHGIGKSALVAWLVCWLMSTRPNCVGTITANTFAQLQTKTWAQIQKWAKLSINAHWWVTTSGRMYHREAPEAWYCSAQTCREENSESFAGQHAASSSSFYVFDEASAVPDKIWEVAEGGLTDGEPHFYAFGNPTRSSGKFYRILWGNEGSAWFKRSIRRGSQARNRTHRAGLSPQPSEQAGARIEARHRAARGGFSRATRCLKWTARAAPRCRPCARDAPPRG